MLIGYNVILDWILDMKVNQRDGRCSKVLKSEAWGL